MTLTIKLQYIPKLESHVDYMYVNINWRHYVIHYSTKDGSYDTKIIC